jgi:predicted amidohydrolase YtcJ
VVAADAIYTGDIVTVDDAQPTAEAVAVKNGRIAAVGAGDQVIGRHRGAQTRVVDLDGNTLLPAFIDPHSHYINSLMVANQVNVYAPPAGPATGIDSIVTALRNFRDTKRIPPGLGKLADLVILDANPLTVDPMTIKDIKVVETIKEGQSIYAS